MNRYEISEYLIERLNLPDLDINDLERTLFVFAADDYFHPVRRIAFPLVLLGVYGKGQKAIVAEVQDSKEQTFALRISSDLSPDQRIAQEFLSGYALAPEILYIGRTRVPGTFFTLMDPIAGTLEGFIHKEYNLNKLMTGMKCLLDKKFALGMLHGDLHLENIVLLRDGETLGFIDFEWTVFTNNPSFLPLTCLDFIPLIGSAILNGDKRLAARLKSYFDSTFNIKIDMSSIVLKPQEGFVYKNQVSYMKGAFLKGDKAVEKFAQALFKTFPSVIVPELID